MLTLGVVVVGLELAGLLLRKGGGVACLVQIVVRVVVAGMVVARSVGSVTDLRGGNVTVLVRVAWCESTLQLPDASLHLVLDSEVLLFDVCLDDGSAALHQKTT